jgi:HSP20 family protein
MSSEDDEDFPEWFRKRRSPFSRGWGFDDFDKVFHQMEKMMEEELKAFSDRVPKDLVKERKLPDGSTVRELGPFVWGYSMRIGPDGKPEVREFGNVKPSLEGPRVKEEREPLVDVVETDGEVQVIAELPGVDKKDIKLHGTEESLTISVDIPQQKYFREVKLPARVRVKEAKTEYKNGVLQVTLPKFSGEKKPKGEPINIE